MGKDKYYDIIFKERVIEDIQNSMNIWKEYSEGNQDIESENDFILDYAQFEIDKIKKLIELNTNESRRELYFMIDDFYDLNHYNYDSYTDCKLDFIENYENILTSEAKKKYDLALDYYGIESATIKYNKLKLKLAKEESELSLMMHKLNNYDKIKLRYFKKFNFYKKYVPENSISEKINNSYKTFDDPIHDVNYYIENILENK